MILLRDLPRSAPAVRAAHVRHVTASDMRAAFADRDSKAHRQLIERLVLDFEGVENHKDETPPDPWQADHDAAIGGAAVRYHLETRREVDRGVVFVQDDLLTWLACSPHALVAENGCLHVRWRKTLRTFRQAVDLDQHELARVHVVMRVCDRAWCDVVDFWDGADPSLDKITVRRVQYDERFFLDTVVARLVLVWQAVAFRRAERARV